MTCLELGEEHDCFSFPSLQLRLVLSLFNLRFLSPSTAIALPALGRLLKRKIRSSLSRSPISWLF
ncbi:hypothetical protein [Oxynema aestuarii]|uniref:Uncharacterized protein n=1 Tax=Oxynema aestuarii AP17 TaxID=2064643 RepID=A0A6H1TUW4_9CYAN|nr:hypothetical protein [Oxynema aestuarii]QIZ70408.1 hypothetical protein HCG48_07295 [Oxynema aestuarii AP17]